MTEDTGTTDEREPFVGEITQKAILFGPKDLDLE
jgi:hypothetical protein